MSVPAFTKLVTVSLGFRVEEQGYPIPPVMHCHRPARVEQGQFLTHLEPLLLEVHYFHDVLRRRHYPDLLENGH
jgi:hypothetical protein